MHKLDYWFLYDIHNKIRHLYKTNSCLSYRLMTMIINTKNQRLSVVDRLEYREVSHKLDKTRAGVLTNRLESVNKL